MKVFLIDRGKCKMPYLLVERILIKKKCLKFQKFSIYIDIKVYPMELSNIEPIYVKNES